MVSERVSPEGSGGLWVFIEENNGAPALVSLELLSQGRILADQLNIAVTTIFIGGEVAHHARELIYYGADTVIIAEDPVVKDYRCEVYTDIIVEHVLKRKPEILLIGATSVGRDLAPRVAARLKTGCMADATKLDIDREMRLIVATKPFLGRNLMADIICPHHRPQIVTVRPGILERQVPDESRQGDLIYADVSVKEEEVRVRVVESMHSHEATVNLSAAEKIVAGGMGLGNAGGFDLLKELADLLGAEVGATSLPVDAGWISQDRKIGQTGKAVRPRLYIACGISGAVQHTAGMINSELIVAINKSPKAEIFDIADYGIVSDLYTVVPAIIDELKAHERRDQKTY
jgi:electron transfer flavoprotein alpha subunit